MKYLQIFMLLLIGCSSNSNQAMKIIKADSARFVKFLYIAKENNIQKLVTLIDRSDCVYIGGIGYTGDESEVYDSYQRLLEIAPDSLWVKLSFNKNPVLRVYALKALVTKNSSKLFEANDRLQKDKDTICYVAGDTRMSFSVSFFVSSTNRRQ